MKKFIFTAGKTKRGFSLIELLVVLSIFVILTVLVLARQTKYTSDSEINNLAYKIALAVRESQVYGLSVKANTTQATGSQFTAGYGIHFDTAKNTFVMFADTNNDEQFNKTTQGGVIAETAVTSYTLDKGITISDFCVDNSSGRICRSTSQYSNLDIVFVRPNPQSNITLSNDVGDEIAGADDAVISIVSPLADKKTKCVKVTAAGQISVGNPTGAGTPTSTFVCP